MHTPEDVQVSFLPHEIKLDETLLAVHGSVELALPWPTADGHFIEDIERVVDEAGQQLKRMLMRLVLEKGDAELVLERIGRSAAGTQQRRGKRAITLKTTFGTVVVHRYRVFDKLSGKTTIPSAEAWDTPQQVVVTRPLRDLVRDVVRDESYRKAARRVARHAGEEDLLSPTCVMNILHEEGAALEEATRQRVESSYRHFPGAETVFSLASETEEGESTKWMDVAEADAALAEEEAWEPPVGFGSEGAEGQSEGPRLVDDERRAVGPVRDSLAHAADRPEAVNPA